MTAKTFEQIVPWSGAVAGLAWIGQAALGRWTGSPDVPGSPGVLQDVHDHVAMNLGSMACKVLMAMALLFFAAAVRNVLRSGEAGEATYSSVAFGGLVSVSGALGIMVLMDKALLDAARDGEAAVTHSLSYVQYFGWLPMGVGIATSFIAIGLGGLRNAVLPTWFARTTIVLGVLAALGAAAIPPGGLVNYLLLPFWLIAAALLIARRQRSAARGSLGVAVAG